MKDVAVAEPPKVDLSIFDTTAACDKGFELQLVHPVSKDPLPVFITVVGKDSQAYKDHVRAKANQNLRRSFKQQRKAAEAPTIEEIEADAVALLVACTTGWRNVVLPGSGELPFNEENCTRIYTDFPAIRAQVDEAISDLENFMKA